MVVLLLLLVALIGGGVWVAITQPWSAPAAESSPTPTPTSSSEATEGPAPSTTPTPSDPTPEAEETPGVTACTTRDVSVAALTDATTYASGVLPKLSISLKNTSERDCTINVGSSTQVLTVSSGSDVWWRSTDCQTEPSDMVVTLPAGEEVTSVQPVIWDRTRSSVHTCDQENRPRAPGGGASYHVSVSIGGVESAQTRQILLY